MIDRIQLIAPQVFNRGGVGWAPEKTDELPHRTDVVAFVLGASLRIRKLSSMRWRNGFIVCVDEVGSTPDFSGTCPP